MVKFIDLHCDTITTIFEKNQCLYENDLHIDIKRFIKFPFSIQFFAIWLKKQYYSNSYNQTKFFINFFKQEIQKNYKFIQQAKSFNDILKNKQLNKLSAILTIEGGESLEGNLNYIDNFFKDGVRVLTLCWNYENQIGYGVMENAKSGLKPFGKDVIKKMNELGMIIDVSHLNEAGFWDVFNLSNKPFIASHSNSFTICNNIRNLKDDQIKAIHYKNGLIGLNFYKKFLTYEKNANFNHIFDHIDYISSLIGFDNIAFGGDFDGIDETPTDLCNISGYKYLFYKMLEKYGEDITKKIFFENSFNFIKENLY